MFSVKKSTVVTAVLFLIPITVSIVSAIKFSVPLMLLAAVLDYAVTALNPFARKRECIYMFPLIAMTSVPVCCAVIGFMIRSGLIDSEFGAVVFLFCFMISAAEIVLELICCMIWKKQYKLKL